MRYTTRGGAAFEVHWIGDRESAGKGKVKDGQLDTLTNPTVIVEVLSPSTEAYDRGVKFAHYQELMSLTDYVLVPQDQARVEHYVRNPDVPGQWVLTVLSHADDILHLASIGCCDVALSDIYDKVDFTAKDKGWRIK